MPAPAGSFIVPERSGQLRDRLRDPPHDDRDPWSSTDTALWREITMNKKLIPVALASLLVLVAAGCSRSDNDGGDRRRCAGTRRPPPRAAAPTTAAPAPAAESPPGARDRRQARRERPRSAPRQHRGPHVVRLHQRRQGPVVLLRHVRRSVAAGHRRRGLDGRARGSTPGSSPPPSVRTAPCSSSPASGRCTRTAATPPPATSPARVLVACGSPSASTAS